MLFILIMMLFGLLFLGFYSMTYFFQDRIDVSGISAENFQKKAHERLKEIEFFNAGFPIALKAIEDNPGFQKFLSEGKNREEIENLFLSVQKATSCTMQIRYLDMQGNEIIKTQGSGTQANRTPINHKITPKEALLTKAHRSYFQEFKQLKEGEIGVSNIELNMENRKLVEPKQPIIRFAKVIYHQGKPQGILILNACLTTFLERFSKTTLYHVYIFDKSGRFILHKNPNDSIGGDQYEHFSIYDTYGYEVGKQLLLQDSYLGENIYSESIDGFAPKQGLKLILELKYNELSNQAKQNANLMMLLILLTIVIMLPVAIYLSRFPDRLMKKLDNQAHHDSLTSLPNKTSLFENMQDAPNEVLVLLRIDNLREINNVYGYLLADELLSELGKKLEDLAKKTAFKAYKLPSNLFAITLTYQNRPHLEKFMHDLHHEIEHDNFNIMDNHEFSLSITLGASNPEIKLPLEEMLIDAEKALHSAIDKKTEYTILDHKIDLKAQYEKNIQVLGLIRQAINNHRVMTFFQPIYNNQTKTIDKYEVLMRLKDESGILYPPNTFLEIAKSSKYYHRLTREIILKSTEFFKNRTEEFSVNISFEDIINEGFLDFLKETIQHNQNCHRMVLEIVESEGLGDYEQISEFIHQVKEMGCKIAIDDFGTGYSNFEHLLRLHKDIDYIKIDGSLIKDIVNNEINLSIVKNIKIFCDDLGIKTIAEFVADTEIQKIVSDIGIDYSQGYYFGQPHSDIINK